MTRHVDATIAPRAIARIIIASSAVIARVVVGADAAPTPGASAEFARSRRLDARWTFARVTVGRARVTVGRVVVDVRVTRARGDARRVKRA